MNDYHKKSVYTDDELRSALKNIESDGISLEIGKCNRGDCELTIASKQYRTVFGYNDLGIWLVQQEKRDSQKNNGFGTLTVNML